MPKSDEEATLISGESGSDSDSGSWESAQNATKLLYKEHGAGIDRSFESDCPWCMTIVLIQLARSTGWRFHFLALAARQCIRLGVAIFVQLSFIWYFGYSLMTITPYGGAPWLCNMGRGFYTCVETITGADHGFVPGGEDCMGPGGREYHKDDLFSDFDVWSTRMYVRDSLAAIFEGNAAMTSIIKGSVVPGEYGLEDEFCRYICLALLGIQVQAEMRDVLNMLVTVCMLPCSSKPWLRYDKKDKDDPIKFEHGGMPWWSKLFSILLIFLRAFIAFYVGCLGVRWLLNTPAIMDLLFNSLGLTFIFGLDELIQDAWSTKEPAKYMEKLDGFSTDRKHCYTMCCDLMHNFIPLPVEFFMACIFIACCVLYNLSLECTTGIFGGLVSDAVFGVQFGHYAIFPWFQEQTHTAQWCPPPQLVPNATCVQ